MKIAMVYLVVFLLPTCVWAQRNACPTLSSYPLAQFALTAWLTRCYVNPNVASNVTESCKRNNLQAKTHKVTTPDGYILTVFEVSGDVRKKFSFFLQHGLGSNSYIWVDKANRSLANYLAKMGYRIFLGNIRGTNYSKKHKNLTMEDPQFWNFNLDTLAANDMVTQLEFAYKQGGQKMHYVGHSMGTTLAMMFASTFTDKASQWIESFSLLAPVTYLDDVRVLEALKLAIMGVTEILNLANRTGIYSTSNSKMKYCVQLPWLCRIAIDTIFGKSKSFPNASRRNIGRHVDFEEDLLLYYGHDPSGVSTYQLQHYRQITSSKRFQKFDYGSRTNLEKYGTASPPLYDLGKVKIPTCLMYGENDLLFNQNNVDRMYREIGSEVKCKHSITSGEAPYNHHDFLYGKNLTQDLYPKILRFIKHNDLDRSWYRKASGAETNKSRATLSLMLFVLVQLANFLYSHYI